MAKRGIIFTLGVFAVGGITALAIGEAATPGSSKKVTDAAGVAVMNAEVSGGAMVSTGIQVVVPIAGDALTAVQNSGIGDVFTQGAPATGAADPTAVPPAAAPTD
jgi:hypothetical protein